MTFANGRAQEVDLLVAGTKDGQPGYLVGECKSRPGQADLKRFKALLGRLEKHFRCPVKGFMVGHSLTPEFQQALATDYPDIDAFQTCESEAIARGGEIDPA